MAWGLIAAFSRRNSLIESERPIVARVRINYVVAGSTHQQIILRTALHPIIASARENGVAPGTGINEIASPTRRRKTRGTIGIHEVVPAASDEMLHFVDIATIENVVAVCLIDIWPVA